MPNKENWLHDIMDIDNDKELASKKSEDDLGWLETAETEEKIDFLEGIENIEVSSSPLYKRPKEKVWKLIRTVPDNEPRGREGIMIQNGKKVYDDSWMWCELCHEDFRLAEITICKSCFELLMEKFKDFLMQEYRISESSAKDYVGRFKGIVNRGKYKGDNQMTPTLKADIEKEFPNSKKHYILTLERYIEFQKKKEK